ncbi:MAG: hypothetical protein DRR19_27170 [Candidatus Parabeggiatoa sp. nov. 1]|nr:MAG: hypothetical protein DRR19_27170 [Gammaproteobacteria bacterium]
MKKCWVDIAVRIQQKVVMLSLFFAIVSLLRFWVVCKNFGGDEKMLGGYRSACSANLRIAVFE